MDDMDRAALHRALVAAHEARDAPRLITLYAQAADCAETPDETAFFLTQAWVLALQAGDERAAEINERLRALGRND